MNNAESRSTVVGNASVQRALHDLSTQLAAVRENRNAFNFFPVDRRSDIAPHAVFEDSSAHGDVAVWCSADCLDMSHHPTVVNAVLAAVKAVGTGSGGSPAMAGTSPYHRELQAELASWYGKEAALLFNSSFTANESALSVLGQRIPDLVVFTDELNHASIRAGIRASGVRKKTFFHNDVGHLRELLGKTDPDVPKLVVFESLYSMEGDFAPIPEIVAAAEESNAMTYIDETHAVGLYGATGTGYAEFTGMTDRITIIDGGLGKAFGCIGGFVAGPRAIVDAVSMFAVPFLNSTATPAALVAGALAGVRHNRAHPDGRETLAARAGQLRTELASAGIPMTRTRSHIVPVLVGDARRARELSALLLRQERIYLEAITSPVVPLGTERLRITVNARYAPEEVTALVAALSRGWSQVGLDRVPTEDV